MQPVSQRTAHSACERPTCAPIEGKATVSAPLRYVGSTVAPATERTTSQGRKVKLGRSQRGGWSEMAICRQTIRRSVSASIEITVDHRRRGAVSDVKL